MANQTKAHGVTLCHAELLVKQAPNDAGGAAVPLLLVPALALGLTSTTATSCSSGGGSVSTGCHMRCFCRPVRELHYSIADVVTSSIV